LGVTWAVGALTATDPPTTILVGAVVAEYHDHPRVRRILAVFADALRRS
jgi:hypothetical protein